jgi:hypothetical protein
MPSSRSRLLGAKAAVLIAAGLSSGCPDTSDPRIGFLDGWLAEHAPRLTSTSRERVVDVLIESELATGIDAFLLLAVMEEESRYDPGARSHKGARGLMQLRPETARSTAASEGIPWSGPEALDDPGKNVRIGAAYLAQMREQFGHWKKALAAYHWGPTRIRRIQRRGGRIPERYSTRVLERHRQIHDAYENFGS